MLRTSIDVVIKVYHIQRNKIVDLHLRVYKTNFRIFKYLEIFQE